MGSEMCIRDRVAVLGLPEILAVAVLGFPVAFVVAVLGSSVVLGVLCVFGFVVLGLPVLLGRECGRILSHVLAAVAVLFD